MDKISACQKYRRVRCILSYFTILSHRKYIETAYSLGKRATIIYKMFNNCVDLMCNKMNQSS